MAPTIIIAAIILALMTVGVLFLVDFLRQPSEEIISNSKTSNTDSLSDLPTGTPQPETVSDVPDMSSLKVEFTALSEPVSLLVTADGKTSSTTVAPGTSVSFEPKESLKLSYSKSLATVVELTISGKKIALPGQPEVPRRNAIEFEINKDNLRRIWETGTISWETVAVEQAVTAANASTAPQSAAPVTSQPPTSSASRPTPQPNPAAANVEPKATEAPPKTSTTMMRNAATPRIASTPAPTPDGQ